MLASQKYGECQLVAVINAAVALGEPPVDKDSEEYERLVDLVGARHGPAISIHKAVEYLRLRVHPIAPITLDKIRLTVMNGHPVSVSVLEPTFGFHEVLLTGGDVKEVGAWNLRRRGFERIGLTWERLDELIASVPLHLRKAGWYELTPLRLVAKSRSGRPGDRGRRQG